MKVLIALVALVWGVRIVLNILTYAQLWWVKEYRWDRMIIHLRTPQGKRFWWPERRRPPISPKSILLVLFSLVFFGYLVWTLGVPILLRLGLADLLSFPITWIFVLMLNAPTGIYHKLLIAKAIRKLRDHKSMIVIGITGSYGKTTTKEYLASILSTRFRVLKTEASKNSPIGIAEVILRKLTSQHEVFVVEMGAYKIGEIAEMAAMARPQIGIVTAINPQHQDLFGSLENTMKAKYELLEGLVGKRIAIMNADNERVSIMAQWAKRDGCDVWERRFSATDVRAEFQGLEFTCMFGNQKARVKAPVIGAHQVSNIVAAIAGAVATGMSFSDAVKAAEFIQPNPKSLGVIPARLPAPERSDGGQGINVLFINDTFNNNPDSAIAALDVLAWAKGKKYLVFQPMIELGAYAAQSHASVGAYAARVCDEILVTNRNFYEDFMKGVRSVSDTVSVSVLSSDNAASLLRGKLGKGDAVLFKGKETERVLRSFV
ncbi:MAG: UDP-N-acetylmuramoyl-tripeptide--D-alanyl-D-alanine ligase [Patescibacteria group bacterium]